MSEEIPEEPLPQEDVHALNPPPEALRNDANNLANVAADRNLPEELQNVADINAGLVAPPDTGPFAFSEFDESTSDVATEIDLPAAPRDVSPMTQGFVQDAAEPPKGRVTNPGHTGKDPKAIRAAQQERIRRERGMPLPQQVNQAEAVDAFRRMEAGIPPNPEAGHEKLDANLKANAQGNDKDQRDELLRAQQAKDDAEREWRRKVIEAFRTVTREIQMDTQALDEVIKAFERGRETF